MIASRHALAASAALSLSVLVTPAAAQIDGQNVSDQLAAQLAYQGLTMTTGSVSTSGDDVTLSDITMEVAPETEPFTIGDLVLQDVSQTSDGSYLVGRIEAPAISYTSEEGVTIDFQGGQIEDYLIAGPDVTDPIMRSGLFRQGRFGGMTVSDDEGTIFSMGESTTTMSPYEAGGMMEYDLMINDMVADMTKLPEADARETMSALGYEELRGDISMDGSWDTGSGQLVIDTMTYSVEDAADLSLSMDFGGYTAELVGAMQDMQAQMRDQSDEAMGMAMLGMMQQIEINGLAIEIDDNSLTNRILDFVGEQQGIDRTGMVAMAKGMLPFALAQLQSPEFAAQATAAIGSFLDNPGTLRIAAEPDNPVPVAQLMAAAMTAPQALITALGVEVTSGE